MRTVSYLHLTRFLQAPLERNDRMGMAASLEVRVPYCATSLVEYVFNVPWAMKAHGGTPKALLRAVAERLLPPAVATRPKSPYPSTEDPAYHAALRREVEAILAERTAPVLELVKRPAARALAAMPPSGAPVVLMLLEKIVNLNRWLVDYRVSIRT